MFCVFLAVCNFLEKSFSCLFWKKKMPPNHMHNFISNFSVQTRISFLKSFFIVSMINSVIKNPSKISLYFPVRNQMTWTNVPKNHERPICMKINEYFCRYRLLLTFLSKPESVFLRASSLLETSFFVKIFLNNNKMKMIEMMSHWFWAPSDSRI